MREGKTYSNNLAVTIDNAKENTLNFENCSFFEEYDYKNKSKVGSALGLCYSENYIVNTIVPYLKKISSIRIFTEEEQAIYSYKPMQLSYDIYGVTDYWWIILCVNGYLNPQSFHSFTQLIIPSKNDLEVVMDKEHYTNDKLGKIPSSTNR